MYDSVITLRAKTYPATNTDEYGNLVAPTITTKNVYAAVVSVGYREYYEAAARGFKPEIKFIMPCRSDYSGESEVTYNNAVYNVIRTYAPQYGDTLELICERGIT